MNLAPDVDEQKKPGALAGDVGLQAHRKGTIKGELRKASPSSFIRTDEKSKPWNRHVIRTQSATEETAGSKDMKLCKITKEA